MLESMIELSANDPADTLMKSVMDPQLGPLEVTSDLQELGMQNTFLTAISMPARRCCAPTQHLPTSAKMSIPVRIVTIRPPPLELGSCSTTFTRALRPGAEPLPPLFPEKFHKMSASR
jgi:hypothetical protein